MEFGFTRMEGGSRSPFSFRKGMWIGFSRALKNLDGRSPMGCGVGPEEAVGDCCA